MATAARTTTPGSGTRQTPPWRTTSRRENRLGRRDHEADGGPAGRRSTRKCSPTSRRRTSTSPTGGRLLLLFADGGGEAVPDLLPQEGQPRRSRAGDARPERARGGREVHGSRGLRPSATTGGLLAYSTDTTGFRQYTLYVKDLQTGEPVEKVAEKVGSVAWAADNKTLFYTVEEESTKRQYRLFRHALGPSGHDLVYEEQDERLQPGRGADAQRGLPDPRHGQPDHLRSALPPRGRARGRVAAGGAPHRRAGVRRRAPRRALLHPDERRRDATSAW